MRSPDMPVSATRVRKLLRGASSEVHRLVPHWPAFLHDFQNHWPTGTLSGSRWKYMEFLLFSDAETRKDRPQQIIAAMHASHVIERRLGETKCIGSEFRHSA